MLYLQIQSKILLQKVRLLFFVFSIFLTFNMVPANASGESKKLTLEECISIALKEHPSAKIAFQNMKAAESRVGMAKATTLPSVELSASYTNSSFPQTDSGSASVISHTGTTQAALKQNLIDFGKRDDKIKEKQKNFEALRAELNVVYNDVVFNVIQAYYGVLAEKEIVYVNKETVLQFEHRLLQAQGFYEVGKRAKIEVTKAEVDLSNARLELIKAKNNEQLAKVKLFNSIGLLEQKEFSIEEKRPATPLLPEFSQIIQQGSNNHPEAIKAKWQRKAQEAVLDANKKEFFPEISGTLGYGWRNNWFPPESPLWSAGVNFTYPIYTGGLLTNQIIEARSHLEAAKANEANVKLAIRFDIEQSYITLKEAIERKSVAALAEKQAEENFILAQGRYAFLF